jgi:hypothetical protein
MRIALSMYSTIYERRRARAMVLLMRYAALRVSDVITVSRDHIKGDRLEKRAVKESVYDPRPAAFGIAKRVGAVAASQGRGKRIEIIFFKRDGERM